MRWDESAPLETFLILFDLESETQRIEFSFLGIFIIIKKDEQKELLKLTMSIVKKYEL